MFPWNIQSRFVPEQFPEVGALNCSISYGEPAFMIPEPSLVNRSLVLTSQLPLLYLDAQSYRQIQQHLYTYTDPSIFSGLVSIFKPAMYDGMNY